MAANDFLNWVDVHSMPSSSVSVPVTVLIPPSLVVPGNPTIRRPTYTAARAREELDRTLDGCPLRATRAQPAWVRAAPDVDADGRATSAVQVGRARPAVQRLPRHRPVRVALVPPRLHLRCLDVLLPGLSSASSF